MKLVRSLAGALVRVLLIAIATYSIGAALPRSAQAQEAPSALEFAVGQPSRLASAPACRGRRCIAAPLDIRSAPQMVALASRYIGSRNPMGFRGPGCKAFVNMIARRAGFYANASARAFDTRGMGQRVAYPQPGDYRVSARRGGGHVEIVARVEGGRVVTINGNKGRNRVGWSHRPIGGAAYYRPIRTASI